MQPIPEVPEERLERLKPAIERFLTAGTVHTWSNGYHGHAINMPKDELLQRMLLKKIREITGEDMSWDELRAGLVAIGFKVPTGDEDTLAITWYRPPKDKQQ